MTTQPWESEYKKTRLYKEGGSCFECCDYEGMVDDMRSFITSTRLSAYKEGQRDMREEVVGLIKGTPITFPQLDEYVKVVGEGNKDDMYNLGFKQCRIDLISEITK